MIRDTKTKQVLHIAFARTTVDEEAWLPGWFSRCVELDAGVDYLAAENKEDLAKADKPLVFISGGSQVLNLKEKLEEEPKLLSLVKNAPFIIGESAGAKILGQFFRKQTGENEYEMHKGLGIIKDTVIEGHYTQRNRKEILKTIVNNTNVKYGIGVDSITALVFELDQFPESFEKIGKGLAEIINL